MSTNPLTASSQTSSQATTPQRGRLGALIATTLVVVAALLAQPRVTPLWSLYVGDRAAANGEVLFLEPFPNSDSCGAAARALGTTGQWTSCRARLSLSLRHSVWLLTLQQEFVPGGAWERLEALCGLNSLSAAPRPGLSGHMLAPDPPNRKVSIRRSGPPAPASRRKKPFAA